MPAHPPNNVCRFWQTLLGVVVKVRQGTPYRRLATNGGEKCGLVYSRSKLLLQSYGIEILGYKTAANLSYVVHADRYGV